LRTNRCDPCQVPFRTHLEYIEDQVTPLDRQACLITKTVQRVVSFRVVWIAGVATQPKNRVAAVEVGCVPDVGQPCGAVVQMHDRQHRDHPSGEVVSDVAHWPTHALGSVDEMPYINGDREIGRQRLVNLLAEPVGVLDRIGSRNHLEDRQHLPHQISRQVRDRVELAFPPLRIGM